MTTLTILDDASNVLPFRSRTEYQLTESSRAIAAVDHGLRGFDDRTLCQARERALRNLRQGETFSNAIRRAVSWARCTRHEPEGAA